MSDSKLKPLFIPLNTEYFTAFACGKKTSEVRMYGPRWNESTCAIGRPVVLSKGYGKHDRLTGAIDSFTRVRGWKLKKADREVALKLFGNINVDYACIGISINRESTGGSQ